MFGDEKEERPTVPVSIRANSLSTSSRVVVVDDFISSGVTMASAMDCVRIAGAQIVEAVAMCDMSESGGTEYIHAKKELSDKNVFTLFRLRNSLDILYDPNRKTQSSL